MRINTPKYEKNDAVIHDEGISAFFFFFKIVNHYPRKTGINITQISQY